jgi:hypothetical protein
MSENEKKTGLSRRDMIRSMAGAAAGGAALGVIGIDKALATPAPAAEQCIDHGRVAPVIGPAIDLHVTPRRLERGDMLLTDQYNAKVYLVRNKQVLPFVDVRTWGRSHLWDAIASHDRKRIYVSMSGLRGPSLDYVGIKGIASIIEVDAETGKLLRTFSSTNEEGWPNHKAFIDPTGLVLTSDNKYLLANDFIGFAHKGMVLRFDLGSGEMKVLASGLMEPSGLSPDGPDHVLIGNARMPGGAELGGQIVRMNVHNSEQEVLFNVNLTTGAMIGAARLTDGTLVGTISDWPDQKRSTVIRVDGPDKFTPLLSPSLAFFSAQVAPDLHEGFWVAESVGRTLYHLNTKGDVLETVRVDECAADYRGPTEPLVRAFDTLESIRLVA